MIYRCHKTYLNAVQNHDNLMGSSLDVCITSGQLGTEGHEDRVGDKRRNK